MLKNEPYSFAFVMNVKGLTGAEAFEIVDGHLLRRATETEIVMIKSSVERYGSGEPAPPHSLWEYPWPDGGEHLRSDEWRYFVIEFTGNNAVLLDLKTSFDVSPVEIEVGLDFIHMIVNGTRALGIGSHAGRLFHVLENARYRSDFFVNISAEDLAIPRHVFSRLHALQSTEPIKRLLTQFGQLKALPHAAPLRFLGYFALLESIITHQPKPEDPYDSITRQVKKKLALLDNRWPIRIDYGDFAGANPDTVWTAMYGYRSLIAHGGNADFRGKQQLLGNAERAARLIKETTKAVLRHSLEEPQLIADLREC